MMTRLYLISDRKTLGCTFYEIFNSILIKFITFHLKVLDRYYFNYNLVYVNKIELLYLICKCIIIYYII